MGTEDTAGEDTEENEEHNREKCIILCNKHIIINRIVVEMWVLVHCCWGLRRKWRLHYWRKENSCYTETQPSVGFCSEIKQKAKLIHDEFWYLSGEISQQSVEGATQFILAAYTKIRENIDKLRKELWSKREQELDDLGDSQPI